MLLSIIFSIIALGGGAATFFLVFYPEWAWIWVWPLSTLLYFFLLLLVYLIYVAIFAVVYAKFSGKVPEKPRPYGMFILSQTSWILIRIFGGWPTFSGWGKLPPIKKKFCLVSNHVSGWDHIGLMAFMSGRRFVCVSKEENMNVFGAGGWMTYTGYPYLKQGDIKGGAEVVERAGKLIKDDICSVAIAPEGTRNKAFPEPMILPFHPGSFQMAVEAKCPIVVIAIQNTNALMKRFPKPTRLYYDCVAVLEYEDYKDMSLAEIATYCHDRILDRLEKKSSRIYHFKKKEEESPK